MSDHDSSSPASGRPGVLARRWFVMLAAFAVLGMAAFSLYGPANANTDDDPGTAGTTYKVSLVSQVATATDEPATTAPDTGDLSVADVAEAANPSVVTIYTFVSGPGAPDGLKQTQPQNGSGDAPEGTPLGAGSGWIYSADGYVVTNAHVVEGADSFVVQYYDGTQVEAELVGRDTFQDVAVLKLQLGDSETVPGVATVGDSSAMRAGDEVVAIGSPLGEFTNSVSDGNIGGLDRSLDSGTGSSLDNLIQHDAEISPGNSGGPLFNMRGEVIGMNVAKVETAASNGATASGLNFAIDGNTVVSLVEEIISTNGSIQHPYLGVQTQVGEQGQVVVAVEPGGPADAAGIQEGDLLVGIDGATVDQDHTFMQLLLEHNPGDTVTITVERAGETQDLQLTLGARPDDV